MGRELFEAFPRVVEEADAILGYSLRTLCLEDPENRLRQTEFTQPALYCVNALTFFAKNRAPDAAAGHSLGEYNALLSAGVFDFGTGLRLVRRRGELMSQARNGSMAAVLGLPEERVRGILAEEGLTGIDVANRNSPKQTVLAGPKGDIEGALDIFTRSGARYVILNVSAAFHSRYMAEAAREFRAFLGGFDFAAPQFPVIANVTARPYGPEPYAVRELLAAQILSPVNWQDSVAFLRTLPEPVFEEIGPGQVLTKLIQENPQSLSAAEAAPQPLRRKPGKNALVFLYTGQGSQYYRMGEAVSRGEPVFREALEECAALADPATGTGLLKILFDAPDPFAPFSRLLYSNPALFAIGYAFTRLLAHRGVEPGAVMGYGCGEFIALTAAGALTVREGMGLAVAQAKAMERYCKPGAMLAVLDASAMADDEPVLFQDCVVAGVNFDKHFLVSGTAPRLAMLAAELNKRGIASHELPVPFALHSADMDAARQEFEEVARGCRWQRPKVPIFSPVRLDWVHEPDAEYAWDCCRAPVRFGEAIRRIEAMRMGRYVDVGPSGTLANFVKYTLGDPDRCVAAASRLSSNLEDLKRLFAVAGAR